MNYIVKQGDSLSKIARDVLGDISLWVELAKLNNLSNPEKIYPGQVINLDIPKRVTIDITSGTPKVINNHGSIPAQNNSNSLTGWLVGFGLAALAVVAYKKFSKEKKNDGKQPT